MEMKRERKWAGLLQNKTASFFWFISFFFCIFFASVFFHSRFSRVFWFSWH